MNSLHRNGWTAVKHTQLKSEKCPYMGVIIVFLFVTVFYSNHKHRDFTSFDMNHN